MNISDAKQISTEQGDEGFTKNLANEIISKDDVLFDVMGTLDELSSVLGICYHYAPSETIKTIQKTLQIMNSGIACDPNQPQKRPLTWAGFGKNDVSFLEKEEQKWLDFRPIAAKFTLPGSEDSLAGAYLDWSRTVCRRAERDVVRYIRQSGRTDLGFVLKYMNRMSDLLFIMAKNN
jgi:cob(I)alamin adenosyltransferase